MMPPRVALSRSRLARLVERYRRIGLGIGLKRQRSGSAAGTPLADRPRQGDHERRAVLGGLPATSGLARQPEALAALADDGADQVPSAAAGRRTG